MARWIIRGVHVLAAAVLMLAAAGATFELIGGWRDARRFPQRGRSVQAGAVKLNLACSGKQQSPTIILDSGMGVPALGWFKVQPEVAKFARVCSYDRAGYGWSEPGPEPRTSLRIAHELKALLAASGEHGPYILVGHSFGGFNVRVFTSLFPNDVAGVVFADASHEDEVDRINAMLPAALREREQAEQRSREILDPILAPLRIHLGLKRWQAMARWRGPTDLPKDFLQELFHLQQQAKYRSAVQSENKFDAQSGAQARATGNFGDRPLIVLTAGNPYEDPDPLLTKADTDKQYNLWVNDLQAQLARLSTRGKQIVVSGSGHMIPFERPDAVVAAVHEVWSAVQR